MRTGLEPPPKVTTKGHREKRDLGTETIELMSRGLIYQYNSGF